MIPPAPTSATPPALAPRPAHGRTVWLAALLLVLTGVAAYLNSLTVPFIFDDSGAIVDNQTIRSLRPLGSVLAPPPEANGAAGRPLVNLSFALNYAAGGLEVPGYHAVNLALHLLAGLTLFGLVRRTLRRPPLAARFGADALPAAFAVALLWTLHPLQTESVTCVTQRSELLGGLFLLLTLYAFARSVDSTSPRRWQAAAVTACLLGVASKEFVAGAPLLVLLYDRTFAAGGFRPALRARPWLYLALTATWVPLALLVAGAEQRGGSVGFGLGITAWSYALKQCEAIGLYLKLAVWPHPLVLDYGTDVVTDPLKVLPQAGLLVALLAGTVWALCRRPVLGFAGAFFFIILAPSSSFVPLTTQTMAEHRMYLPLAAVLMLAVAGLQTWFGRRALLGWLAVAAVGGVLTIRRNSDYQTPLAIWADTAAKQPGNARAQYNLGCELAKVGRRPEAMVRYERALQLDPDYGTAHNNYGNALLHLGRLEEGLAQLQLARHLDPLNALVYSNLGLVLAKLGRTREAVAESEIARRLDPTLAEPCLVIGEALAHQGRMAEAAVQFHLAVQLRPDLSNAQNNLGSALWWLGRPADALPFFEAAVRLMPDYAEARANLGSALFALGRIEEARQQFETVLRLAPADVPARENLGAAMQALGRTEEAAKEFDGVLRLDPANVMAHFGLGKAQAKLGRMSLALEQLRETVRLKPDFAEAHASLGLVLLQSDQPAAAVAEFEAILRLKPSDAVAHGNLGSALAQSGRLEEATAEYQAALQLRPSDAGTHYNLGRTLLRLGRPTEAAGHFAQALAIQPDFPDARQQLDALSPPATGR